jgi:hypothetical protein
VSTIIYVGLPHEEMLIPTERDDLLLTGKDVQLPTEIYDLLLTGEDVQLLTGGDVQLLTGEDVQLLTEEDIQLLTTEDVQLLKLESMSDSPPEKRNIAVVLLRNKIKYPGCHSMMQSDDGGYIEEVTLQPPANVLQLPAVCGVGAGAGG